MASEIKIKELQVAYLVMANLVSTAMAGACLRNIVNPQSASFQVVCDKTKKINASGEKVNDQDGIPMESKTVMREAKWPGARCGTRPTIRLDSDILILLDVPMPADTGWMSPSVRRW